MSRFQLLFNIFLLLLCTTTSLDAQKIIKTIDGYQRGETHIHESRIGAYYEEYDFVAHYKYRKQFSFRRMSNKAVKFGLFTSGTGLALVALGQAQANTTTTVGGLLLIVGLPIIIISGPIAIIQNNKSDKAMEYFNNNPENFKQYNDSSYLQLGLTGNGVGLVLTF